MGGDIDNTQDVELSYRAGIIRRVIYSGRFVEAARIRVAYINLDYKHVPVWKAYDPLNLSWDAPWKQVSWKNIYDIWMPRTERTECGRGITFSVEKFSSDGLCVELPKAELHITQDLKAHLASLDAT